MNDFELERLLKSARAPDRTDDYWERFPRHVTSGLRRAAAVERSDGRGFPRLACWMAAAAACLIVGFAVGLWRGRSSGEAAARLAVARRFYREIEALFPNQIQAIVFDQRGARLILAENPDVPDSPPLYLRVCGPRGCQSFVTFSGQKIRVNGDECEVLADVSGNVMLVGSKLFWTGPGPGLAAGRLRIEAQALGYAL